MAFKGKIQKSKPMASEVEKESKTPLKTTPEMVRMVSIRGSKRVVEVGSEAYEFLKQYPELWSVEV